MSSARRPAGWRLRVLVGVVFYVLMMVAWIYGRVDGPDADRLDALTLLVVVAHVAIGFLIGRLWAPLLVLSLVVLGAPAGTQDGSESPVLLALALYEMPVGALLLLLGVALYRATL